MRREVLEFPWSQLIFNCYYYRREVRFTPLFFQTIKLIPTLIHNRGQIFVSPYRAGRMYSNATLSHLLQPNQFLPLGPKYLLQFGTLWTSRMCGSSNFQFFQGYQNIHRILPENAPLSGNHPQSKRNCPHEQSTGAMFSFPLAAHSRMDHWIVLWLVERWDRWFQPDPSGTAVLGQPGYNMVEVIQSHAKL